MKKIILFAIMLLGAAGLYAQRPGGGTPLTPEQRTENIMTTLTKTIEVSDAQKTELTTIFKEFYQAQSENRGNWDKMKELATARDEKVKTVLADDAKYEAYTKFMEEQMQRRRPGGGGGNRK
ncbi:MAG: hypothetical protein SFU99_12975 [Saprospiraceae bacterium]|nr:hypothetical protein [Saprospiraceae bacterium]